MCFANKGSKIKKHAQLQQYNVGAFFERIAIDFNDPFLGTNFGNHYPLVLMDYFIKLSEVIALPNQQPVAVVNFHQ